MEAGKVEPRAVGGTVQRFWAPNRRLWRQWAVWGARHGPEVWLRYSPLGFGLLFAVLLRRQREVIKNHLRQAQGTGPWWAEQRAIAATFINYAHCFAESLALERYQPVVELEGEQWLTGLDGQVGWVALTAHLGPWEAAATSLAKSLGRPVTLVMAAEPDSGARALSDALRVQAGLSVVTVEDDPVGALVLLQRLRAGGVVAGQMDRVPKGCRARAMAVEDRSYLLPEGLVRLAVLGGVAAVPVFCSRQGFFRYRVRICQPLQLGPGNRNLEAALGQYAGELDRALRAYPTQWFQFSD